MINIVIRFIGQVLCWSAMEIEETACKKKDFLIHEATRRRDGESGRRGDGALRLFTRRIALSPFHRFALLRAASCGFVEEYLTGNYREPNL